MRDMKNLKSFYWFIIFSMLFIPISNSFVVNIKKLIKSLIANNSYNKLHTELSAENNKLFNKLKYYESSEGLKSLVKDRLNKVEDGELLIKFKDKNY